MVLTMATRNKSAKKARNISREPVASIMVPQEVKEQFDCFKAAYAARAGAATNEQVLRRWMDGIGTAFDSKVAQEAQKLYRQRKKARKIKEIVDNNVHINTL